MRREREPNLRGCPAFHFSLGKHKTMAIEIPLYIRVLYKPSFPGIAAKYTSFNDACLNRSAIVVSQNSNPTQQTQRCMHADAPKRRTPNPWVHLLNPENPRSQKETLP